MLSKRENEILKMVAWDCLSCKEIADKLFISAITVQNHIHNIKTKEHLSKMTELSKIFYTKYYRNIGSVILILIFSIQLISCDDMNARARRARRTGRRFETELIEEFDFEYE